VKNLIFTVTSTELNSLVNVEKDVTLSISVNLPTGGTSVTNWFPLELYIPNTTGTDILFNIFEDAEEYAEFVASPTNFQFLPVKNGNSLSNPDVTKFYKIIIRGVTATAVQDLLIYCINYQDIKGA
jgi:hypothetical protein